MVNLEYTLWHKNIQVQAEYQRFFFKTPLKMACTSFFGIGLLHDSYLRLRMLQCAKGKIWPSILAEKMLGPKKEGKGFFFMIKRWKNAFFGALEASKGLQSARPNFSLWYFFHNSKNKNRRNGKIDFSYDSALCAALMKMGAKLKGDVCISFLI